MSDKSVVEDLNRISASTGFNWLNAIPAHWRLQQLRYLADIRFSNVDKKSDENELLVKLCNYTDVYYNRLITSQIDFMEATATQEEIEKFGLRAGDVLVTKDSESWDDIAIPAYVPETLPDVICGYHLALIRPDDIQLGRYLAWAFASSAIAYQFNIAASGITRYGLSQQAIKDAWFPIPPLHEQRAIADFLDRETAHIDALIARKQRLLDLLAERRQALITHAVTKGLDPDAPMKDSGVEWLGEIPEGWGLASLKHVAEVRTGIAKGRVLNSDNAIPVPYLRVANVQDGYLDLSDVAEIEVLPHELPQYSLQIGDVLMNEGGDSDKLGRGAVWDGSIEPCIHQNHVFAVRCFDVDPEWLSAITSSDYAKAYFESRAKQTTNLASISATNLRELPVVTPRRDEQTAIVTFLEQQTSKIDTLCDRIRRVVASLQERRAALINEAVTGKIRVTE